MSLSNFSSAFLFRTSPDSFNLVSNDSANGVFRVATSDITFIPVRKASFPMALAPRDKRGRTRRNTPARKFPIPPWPLWYGTPTNIRPTPPLQLERRNTCRNDPSSFCYNYCTRLKWRVTVSVPWLNGIGWPSWSLISISIAWNVLNKSGKYIGGEKTFTLMKP